MDATMMAMNSFFTHLIKGIDIKRYGDDLQSLPTGKSIRTYRYSNSILKYMPKDELKTFIKTLLNAEDDVQVFRGCNSSPHNNDNTSSGTDNNLSNRLAKYTNTIQGKENHKIPLNFLCNIGLVNLPLKLDAKMF